MPFFSDLRKVTRQHSSSVRCSTRKINYLMLEADVKKIDFIKTTVWVSTNVLSSVGLILTNKVLMGPPFNFIYVFTLTSIHFFATALTMEVMALAQIFSRSRLNWSSTAVMSIACALSVGLMNLSLKVNSLGFYQLCKLLGVPWLVLIQVVVYKKHSTCAVKVSLAIILFGMALATIKSIHLNLVGCIVGFLAVIVTTQFQIWQGLKQHEFQLNAMQINHAQALPTFFVCTILAILIEFNSSIHNNSIASHIWTLRQVKWILFSAVLAACVNLCSYGLIGNTSTITFQVVGHAKTVLVLLASYFLYHEKTQIKWNNIIGIVIALCGTTLYGYLRHNATAHQNLSVMFTQTAFKRIIRPSEDQQHPAEESLNDPIKTNISEKDSVKPV